MSATGIFAEAQATLAASLTALGLAVVTDSRNARPMSVVIEPPTFTCFNSNIADITFRLRVLAAPPGNQDASDYLMTTADAGNRATLTVSPRSPGPTFYWGRSCTGQRFTVSAVRLIPTRPSRTWAARRESAGET